ncbi:MAG: polysulfide reductase NrfD [Chloroflexota bacterium]|nr:polysulfide reductase NrfD [Chloroflexota bacterium]
MLEEVRQPRRDGRAEQESPIQPGHTPATVTDKISTLVLEKATPLWWWLGFAVAFALVMLLLYAVADLLVRGVGIWGINIPVAWGFAITNFAWWIGIAHAGTLISALLLLMHREWRISVSRFAEAASLFALAAAGLFPILHLGRPWLFYWMVPYPNTMGLWPQWRSPLVWDFFAIGAHALLSIMFWYVGLIPDLATLRDRARKQWIKKVYALLALGWRGDAFHWQQYRRAYFLLAALAVPLIFFVHSIIGMDFAVAILPGWHSTLFPPYFVAGAIFSGFATVVMIAIPLRALFRLHDLITAHHLDNIAKIILASGLLIVYSYLVQLFGSWYSGRETEWLLVIGRTLGPYAPTFWTMILANVMVIQLLWFRRIRTNVLALFVIAVIVNIGMWLTYFIIVVTSLYRNYRPSMWRLFTPTFWDWATFIGTIGLFIALMFLFIRLLPLIPIHEMEELVAEEQEG